MDRETKQWIVDRVIWVMGLTVGVLVAATALAGEHAAPSAGGEASIACRPEVVFLSESAAEAR